MSFSLVSEYEPACQLLIGEVLGRPRLFYSTLSGLEAMMQGHEVAFRQFGSIEGEVSFNRDFGIWLHRECGVSTSAGWAVALADMAGDPVVPRERFSILVRRFLSVWASPVGE